MEIIRITVDDHRSSDEIAHPEAVCPYFQMSVSLLHQQRRKITCVPGMIGLMRIVVAAGLRKACTGAAASFVDVKAKETCFAVLRKPGDISYYQHTAGFLIEPNLTIDIGCVRSASDICVLRAGRGLQSVKMGVEYYPKMSRHQKNVGK